MPDNLEGGAVSLGDIQTEFEVANTIRISVKNASISFTTLDAFTLSSSFN